MVGSEEAGHQAHRNAHLSTRLCEPRQWGAGGVGYQGGEVKITKISYRKLVSFGNFENEAIEAESVVMQNQSPEEVLQELRGFVWSELSHDEDMRNEKRSLETEIRYLKGKAEDLRNDTEDLERTFEENRDMMERFGIHWDFKLPY